PGRASLPFRRFPGPAPRRVPFFGPRRPLGFPVTPFPGGTPMATDTPNMLNATLPLKQDPASQAKIKEFAARFKDDISPKVWEVLKKSRMVHYARFTVIQEAGVAKYVQILTEYDTDFITYSQFFADNLGDFFRTVFSLVEGAPQGPVDRQTIFDFIKKNDLPCL